jgi:Ion channel
MTDLPNQELPPGKRRRLVFQAVLRGVLSTTVLVVLYYLLPLDQPWDGDTAVRILIGLVVFAGIMVWQVRAIAGSRYPGMKAFEALALIVPFYLLVFASTYFVMERASAANFTQPLTRTDALYFTVTVFSTVGFGDITPKSEAARAVVIVRCSATSRCWAPARGSCWGPSAEASNEARIPATKLVRLPGEPACTPGRLRPPGG